MTQNDAIDRLVGRMRAKEIATQEMADMLGVSAQHLYRIIRRERMPSYPLLQAWARALGGELFAAYVLNWRGKGITTHEEEAADETNPS